MRALNARVVELEKRVAVQTKEITLVKSKATEEKEQAFAEAHAHEKAKQQMALAVAQLQDSEKDLKHRLNQSIQAQNESDMVIKQYKESLLRLETEKKCLEIDLQRRYKSGAEQGTEDLVRTLRIENQELRMRLDEINLGGSGTKINPNILNNGFSPV